MLVKKDQEIKKLKTSKGINDTVTMPTELSQKSEDLNQSNVHGMEINSNNSGIESDSSDEEGMARPKRAGSMQGPRPRVGNQVKSGGDPMDSSSRAYIKNVLLKYLEYQANGQEKEQLMMEKVLFTVLKVAESEISKVQDARIKNYNSGLLSYIWAPEENKIVAHPVKPRAYNP